MSDRSKSSATLIPATNGSRVKGQRGGTACPFILKIDNGQDANVSMVKIWSIGIATPPAVDRLQMEKELGTMPAASTGLKGTSTQSEERPALERFYAAALVVDLFSSDAKPDEVEGGVKVERLPVERLKTAQEIGASSQAPSVR
ncbi:hypothetical protein T440DRAFT_512848 [Plenodomus tracheiphilus IPT5]|uniref:Uncharacterized protein n=1 Tax=Plenodomus tracheiphilus IPT5 TaxID=1408161 RepID=A0A6A7BN78_9PLEO|nr:hypothetical protein T440DRAFT_512848 [Plenodomus tracheiphilus IPT5]